MLKIVYNKKKIQFISSCEARKSVFLLVALPLMKYVFLASLGEINGIFIPKI